MHGRLKTIALAVSLVCVQACCASQSLAKPGAEQPTPSPPPEARIDINHAATEQLLKVPGMTRSWAERIVRFRPYRSKQDLVDQGVMPSAVYDRIKNYIIAHHDKP